MRTIIFSLLAFCASAVAGQIPGTAVYGTILGNYDGDQVMVMIDSMKATVRLADLNTPERRGLCRKEQPGAIAAKNALAGLCPEGSGVWIDTSRGRDVYKRIIGRVWTADSLLVDVSGDQLRKGWGWFDKTGNMPPEVLREHRKAEKLARLEGVGIWNKTDYPLRNYHPRTWRKKYSKGVIYRMAHPFAEWD